MAGYSIENTVWPAFAVPNDTKLLLDKFFSIVDDPGADAGDRLADEVFTHDGIMVAAAGTTRGSSGTSCGKGQRLLSS